MKDSRIQKLSLDGVIRMKKVLMIFMALFMSVMCTACLNNFNSFAIQELNNKAKEYLNKGDMEKAISRLESNVDLDGNIFETRYNLAVAYTQAKEYEKALAQLKVAKELNPENADVYYLTGVAAEGKANEIIEADEDDNDEKKKLSLEDKTEIAKNFALAIESYDTYITKNPETKEKTAIEEKMMELMNEVIKYDPTYKSQTENTNAEN